MAEALTPELCREHLKAVIDPEIFQNIVDLGLVYGIEVNDDNHVTVNMTLTTPHCPLGPQIIENVEQTLQAHGASAVTVNIVWEPMWTPDAMTDDLKRQLRHPRRGRRRACAATRDRPAAARPARKEGLPQPPVRFLNAKPALL